MSADTLSQNGVFPPEELERGQNIVRIEIRCMEWKIRALKKKYKVDSISDFMLYGDKIGDELYNYYLSRIFNRGSYGGVANRQKCNI